MRIWMLIWNLPHLLIGLYLQLFILLDSVSLAYSGKTPEQLAAIANCTKHERHTRNYDYMEGGDVRIRRLFSGTQWFLTIDDTGTISGTQNPNNCYSILEIRTVLEGVLVIKGVKSKYYISMNRTGILRGRKEYNESCHFKEVFLENFYSAYSSAKFTKQNGTEMFIALSKAGKPVRGRKTRKEHTSSHFLPRDVKDDASGQVD